MTEEVSLREKLRTKIPTSMGGNLIDIPLDTETLDYAIDRALDKYKQKSSNSVEEAYTFLKIIPDKNEYILPEETIEVRRIFRQRFGTGNDGVGDGSGGVQFDPFDIAFTNLYLLQASSMGGLLTYNLYNQYLNTANVMFGGNMNFTWNQETRKLQLIRDPRAYEEILLWVYKYKTENQLLANLYSKMWIFEASIAYTKMAIGNAYEQYPNLAGPQGGVQLNGAQLKAEATAELDRLEKAIGNYEDGGTPGFFVIG